MEISKKKKQRLLYDSKHFYFFRKLRHAFLSSFLIRIFRVHIIHLSYISFKIRLRKETSTM